jgi:hypothetical protein
LYDSASQQGRQNVGMRSFTLFLLSSCFAFACHAQTIYKWVDANGKTHYSQNKDDAANAKAAEVKVDTKPVGTVAPSLPPPAQPQKAAPRPKPPVEAPPASQPQLFSDKRPDDDATRCELARKILSGKVVRASGRPLDQNEIDTAKNDVKAFCR